LRRRAATREQTQGRNATSNPALCRLSVDVESSSAISRHPRQRRARLVELGVIESWPRRGHRLKISRQIVWRRDGPVRQAYERQVKAEFLQADFAGQGDFFGWQPAELTAASIEVLRRKLALLYREFLELAELDSTSSKTRHSTALLVAFRPWVFSLVAARRRKASRPAV
jgi:hypothetical protein